jgi:hypothetical protein
MKKILVVFTLIVLLVSVAYCGQIEQLICPEKIVSKNINITIVPANTYRSSVYAKSSAMLNVLVIKLKGQEMDTLFEKDYPKFKLNNLPSYSKNFNQSIYISNIADNKEKIILVYNIIYKTKESFLTIPSVHYIGKGATNDKFTISI